MNGTFTFLGTGASSGIPAIGCKCAVCQSPSLFNKRLRPSGLLRVAGKTLLIDIGPDFRTQALGVHLDHLDGLLLTHSHYDHIAGIDELRVFYYLNKKPFPCLLSAESLKAIQSRYKYLFRPPEKKGTQAAKITFSPLEADTGTVVFEGVQIGYFSYFQSRTKVTGFRIGNFAYISDIREYDDSIFDSLKGVEKLVVSALKPEPTDVHFSLSEAAAFAQRVDAKAWITHISHYLEHEEANAMLPPSVRMGYDGLTIEFNYGI